MFHGRSDELNKEEILKLLGDSNGCIRVLIATIAYGMGIDCKDVKSVFFYGPSYNCETSLQKMIERNGKVRISANQLFCTQI